MPAVTTAASVSVQHWYVVLHMEPCFVLWPSEHCWVLPGLDFAKELSLFLKDPLILMMLHLHVITGILLPRALQHHKAVQ